MSTTMSAPDSITLDPLLELIRGRRVVVLSGAGCSTESGIPDYRGPEGSLTKRAPMQYAEFVRHPTSRARYWARSAVGWPRLRSARPNAAHQALGRLEAAGVVKGVVTQNVDGLHHEGGSRRVVELHGTLARVRCLDCDRTVPRDAVQQRLLALNPGWLERVDRRVLNGGVDGEADGALATSAAPTTPATGRTSTTRVDVAPDGDAELPDLALDSFRVPGCEACGGVLKPDVVFFGENVPKAVVEEAWSLFGEAEVLLVAGSSLTVYSGRRFIYRAEKEGVPVAVVNLGPTRADGVAAVKVDGRLGSVLPRVSEALSRAH